MPFLLNYQIKPSPHTNILKKQSTRPSFNSYEIKWLNLTSLIKLNREINVNYIYAPPPPIIQPNIVGIPWFLWFLFLNCVSVSNEWYQRNQTANDWGEHYLHKPLIPHAHTLYSAITTALNNTYELILSTIWRWTPPTTSPHTIPTHYMLEMTQHKIARNRTEIKLLWYCYDNDDEDYAKPYLLCTVTTLTIIYRLEKGRI